MTISYLEFFVEEPSMEAALRALVPKIRPDVSFDVHPFEGKADLLAKLPHRLAGYTSWMPEDWRIVIVLDEDRSDCSALKAQVEAIASRAKLRPKRRTGRARFQVLTRIAVEELEAWVLGDIPALVKTYPGVPATLARRRGFRDPDAIRGGTWEALERVLQEAGHFQGGLPKIQVAREVAANMDPSRNSSPSFRAFYNGLKSL